MKKIGICSLMFLLLGYIICFSFNVKAESGISSETDYNYEENKCIVVLNEAASAQEESFVKSISYDSRFENVEKLTEDFGTSRNSYRSIFEITLVKEKNTDMKEIIEEFNNRGDVVSACPNYEVELAETYTNDTKYVEQKIVHNLISLPRAWDICTGSSSVKVGVLDTGIEGTHSDLKSQIDNSLSRDFTYGDCKEVGIASDYGYHGTHVSGIIGAKGNNENGISGVCWDVTLISLAVFESGKGKISDVIRGINYAEEKSIPIINMSLKGYQEWYYGVNVEEVYTSALRNYSGLAICAAGNESQNNDGNNPCFPGSVELDNVISVGNSDENDKKDSDSNYGKSSVDLFAPGVNIYSTYIYNSYKSLSGSSMATPFVTGVAALLLSKYPYMSPSEIKATILQNVDKVSSLSSYCVSGGRLNAYKTLSNPHFHKLNYSSVDSMKHVETCSTCGYSGEQKHSFYNGFCSKCGIEHNCTYSYSYYDRSSHILMCSCGKQTGEAKSHVVKSTSGYMATCLICKATLNLRDDFAQTPFSIIKRYSTPNGSYIMDNGIIVLVEEDIESYFLGNLTFYNNSLCLS